MPRYYILSMRERAHGGKRKRFRGLLKYPKDEWNTKSQVKKSRAYKILKEQGREPRIRTLVK